MTAAKSVKRSDVSLDAGSLLLRAETRKGKTRDRLHKLHPTTVAMIQSIWWPDRELLLPWPYCPSYLWIRYRLLLKRAGLPFDRMHKFHALRRSVASYYELAGGNATRLLDHSSRDLTVKHYLDSRILGEVQPACDLLFRPGERPPAA